MTTQEKIEAIRQECIRVNPTIIEPELRKGFLCLVSRSGERWVASYDVAIDHSALNDPDHLEILEIIGRKITLPDVLLAIAFSEKNWHQEDLGCSNIEIEWNTKTVELNANNGTYCRWNLLKPLEEQEEPTIDFIHDLLK